MKNLLSTLAAPATFGIVAGLTVYLGIRLVAAPVEMLLPILLAGLCVFLQHRANARLIRQNEILQNSLLSLSCNASAAALSQLRATNELENQPKTVINDRAPTPYAS